MKQLFVIILAIGLSLTLFAVDPVILEEVNEPKTVNVEGDRLIISEEESIYIYSLKTLKLLKKFGQKGEGPGEFKMGHGAGSLKIDRSGNNLVVNSSTKVTWFSMDGEYIREEKTPPMLYLIPVKDGYAGNCLTDTGRRFPVQSVCLFDKNFKKEKTLMKSGVPIGMGAKIMMPAYKFKYVIHNNKIYLSAGTNKINIKVFDSGGTELKNIELSVKLLSMNAAYRNMVKTFYKTDPAYKNFWGYMKEHLYFPEFFPGLKDFFVDRDSFYIQTWNKKGEKLEWIILNKTGKELKRIFLPQGKGSAIAYSPYTVADGKYYYLKEDIEKEAWGLYSIDLNNL